MPTPTIIKGEEYFFTTIYSGNGQGQRVGKFLPFTDSGTIDNSCLFKGATNNFLSRTASSNGSGTTLTFSCWVKRGLLGERDIMFTNDFSANGEVLQFDSSNRLYYYKVQGGWSYISNRTFEDTSKFYHILIERDTTNSTASDRIKIYVDGDRITSFATETQPSLNATGFWNQTTYSHTVGNSGNASYIRGIGYLSEVNMIDGTALTPSTFGQTDTSTGRWIPKTLSGITYGTNGFRLTFADSSALGDDTSGNTNDFSSTNLTTSNQRSDTPTNNLPIMRPYNPDYGTSFLSEGNLQVRYSGTNVGYPFACTLRPNSGKWYAEVRTLSNGGGSVISMGVYIQEDMHFWDNTANFYPGGQMSNGDGCGAGLQVSTGTNYLVTSTLDAGVVTSNPTYSLSAGDVFGIAVDRDNDLVSFYGNDGSLIGSTTIPSGSVIFTAMAVNTPSSDGWDWNFGDNPTFNGNETAGGNTDAQGNGNFYHSVPTGFKMLRQDSMPETDKGISSMVWAKNRDNGNRGHQLYDSSRGPLLTLYPNGNNAESTNADSLQKFLKGGFSAEDFTGLNEASESHVAWNWVANAGTTASNTDGSTTTTTQANTTAGFSIVEFTTPSGGTTITYGHGLTQAPEWFFFKNKGATGDWLVFHKSAYDASNGGYSMVLNSTNANSAFNTEFGATAIYPQAPTATTFALRNRSATSPSANYIAYCWHGVDGFSKFGSYTGNGNSNGSFVYTGFKPSWIMFKCISSGSTGWGIRDTSRSSLNPLTADIQAQRSNAEVTSGSTIVDFVSNGFKCRGNSSAVNGSGQTYIYMAFAEHPFIGDGVSPVTAR